MVELLPISIAERLANRSIIDESLAKAVKDSLMTHARLGRSVPHQSNGQVVWITPAEIFARYGFDEFGRPLEPQAS